MKTSDRRAIADRAMNQIDKLEMEIRAQMLQHNIKELDADYANFKAYSVLKDLHTQYQSWKKEYQTHADHDELVKLVGQSEHDILREYYENLTSDTHLITIETVEDIHFYERDTGTGQDEKVRYKLNFEQVKILPFRCDYNDALDCLFIRVNMAGIPH